MMDFKKPSSGCVQEDKLYNFTTVINKLIKDEISILLHNIHNVIYKKL